MYVCATVGSTLRFARAQFGRIYMSGEVNKTTSLRKYGVYAIEGGFHVGILWE